MGQPVRGRDAGQILAALKAARVGQDGKLDDVTWRERLADRFGSRWKVPKLRRRKGGPQTMDDPQQDGTRTRRRGIKKRRNGGGGGSTGGTTGKRVLGTAGNGHEADEVMVAGGIPTYRKVGADSIGAGMLAAWQPNDPQHKEGVVLLNVEHPVIRTEVEHWQAMYPDHLATEIATEIENIYGEIAVAKVAHSEHLKGIIPSKTIDDLLRSEEALTMSLLGLIAEEAVIAPRVGGKFAAKKKAVA